MTILEGEKRGYLLGMIAGMGLVITTGLPSFLEPLALDLSAKAVILMKTFIEKFDFTEEEFFDELKELRDWVDLDTFLEGVSEIPEKELARLAEYGIKTLEE